MNKNKTSSDIREGKLSRKRRRRRRACGRLTEVEVGASQLAVNKTPPTYALPVDPFAGNGEHNI